MKYMGLDYGGKTVGVALTDETGVIPRSVCVIRRDSEKRLRKTLREIENIILKEGVQEIVVGLPLNMDGSEGERAEMARNFGYMVMRRTGLPVHFMDERLTTVEAEAIMSENGIHSEKERKNRVDSVAAAVILEDFLNNG